MQPAGPILSRMTSSSATAGQQEVTAKVDPRAALTNMATGSLAGALAKTAMAPLDRTKIYFQTRPDKKYRILNVLKYLRKTRAATGVLSLWRGNTATMARIVPYTGLQYMSYEQYKKALGLSGDKKRQQPGVRTFAAGSLAGLTSSAACYPLDRARAVMAVTRADEYKNLSAVFRFAAYTRRLTMKRTSSQEMAQWFP